MTNSLWLRQYYVLDECNTVIVFYNRFYQKTRKSQATKDGGLEKFTGKWESFQQTSLRKQRVSTEFRR